ILFFCTVFVQIAAFRNVAIKTYVLHEENDKKYIVTRAAVTVDTNESPLIFARDTFGFDSDFSATYSGDVMLHCREVPSRHNEVLLGDVQHSTEDSTSVNHEYAKILVDCAATPSVNRKKRRLRRSTSLVAGEDWCSASNVQASSMKYDTVGEETCCRQHEFCPMLIPTGVKKYDLYNHQPYTIRHCQCDLRFESCLKKVNSSTADFIAILYFNSLPRQCFELQRDRICAQWKKYGKCTKYGTALKATFKDLPYY
uniref:Phospholipase A2 domain-containing protein n=1 Tax=Parascaris univalens TaxID=6257 RepID=A0A915ART4_PARUN